VIKGRAWKFGDHISTDFMMPSFTAGATAREKAAFCMRANRPEFAAEVKPGDVIVAGRNFGCGSSRPASENLLALGIGCVIAASFGRIFFRSAIGHGLPVLICQGLLDGIQEGDEIHIDLETGKIENTVRGGTWRAEPLPEVALNILSAGGVVPLLKKEYGSIPEKEEGR
jgi:3-isopropylmalate/(R)-2-methylmalate dehydratase small subunit